MSSRQRLGGDAVSIHSATLDRVRDAVVVVQGVAGSPDAVIVYANEAFVQWVGVPRESIIGDSPYHMLSTKEDRGTLDVALGLVGDGKPATTKLVQRKGDSLVWVEVDFEPITELDEPHWIVFQRDVTERERRIAQEFLLDRASTLGALSSGVAHELNNPLSFVRANVEYVAEILKKGDPGESSEELVEVLDETRIGLDRLSRVARDLRLLTMERGTDIMEPTDVRDALQSALNLGGAMVKRKASLRVSIDEYVPLVVGNAGQLIQIFANLIINAADALPTSRSGAVAVSLWNEGPYVFVRVEDSGPGVPDDIASLIFEPFFTTKPPGAGAGMGLARCLEFVAGHDGEIDLGSSDLGGASFTLRFPSVVRRDEKSEGSEEPRPRILVIDDEPRIAKAVARLLAANYETEHCVDAVVALERIDAGERFDAVVCDVLMIPLMGIGFHRELVERASPLASRVLFVTGGALSASDHIYLQDQGCELIRKPLRRDVLLKSVRAILSR